MNRQLRKLSGSLIVRLFLTYVLVAILTGVAITAITFAIMFGASNHPTLANYQEAAMLYSTFWLSGQPDGQATDLNTDIMEGWTIVVSPQDEVLWTRGDTTCRSGMQVSECEPEALEITAEGQFFEHNGEQWAEILIPMVLGNRLILRRGPVIAEPYLVYGNFLVKGYIAIFMFEIISRGILSVPIALALAWLIAHRQVQRLLRITHTSGHFAEGALEARVNDFHDDDIGRLAQQFDNMAGALAQNIDTLHELARRNAELALQAEQSAIIAERARISRDLHDALAQRLFSLSISTTTLPTLISQDKERGIAQAKAIVDLAEQTLIDLRGLLIELRPSNLLNYGLSDSLKMMFTQWQSIHQIQIESSIMLTGRYIPNTIEDTIYQITQEALSNVVRHASASLVELSLVEGHQRIALSISDNGNGFDLKSVGEKAKFGLMSMRERAQMLGGDFSVESEIGKGTTIQISLPVASS